MYETRRRSTYLKVFLLLISVSRFGNKSAFGYSQAESDTEASGPVNTVKFNDYFCVHRSRFIDKPKLNTQSRKCIVLSGLIVSGLLQVK